MKWEVGALGQNLVVKLSRHCPRNGK